MDLDLSLNQASPLRASVILRRQALVALGPPSPPQHVSHAGSNTPLRPHAHVSSLYRYHAVDSADSLDKYLMSGTSGWNHKGSIGWCNYTGMDDVRRNVLSSWLMSLLPLGSFSFAVLSALPLLHLVLTAEHRRRILHSLTAGRRTGKPGGDGRVCWRAAALLLATTVSR